MKNVGENLKNQFKNTFNFPNDIIKFIFLLRKIINHYEFMDDQKKFNEKSLPEKIKILY